MRFFQKKTRFVFQTMHISFCRDYIGGSGAVVTGLLSACALPGRGDLVAAEVTLTATGRRSDLWLRADDGRRERHFCPISYNKVKKMGKL